MTQGERRQINESTFHAVITVVTLATDAIVVSQADSMLKSVCIVTCLSTCRVGEPGLEGSSSTGLLACPAAGVLPSATGAADLGPSTAAAASCARMMSAAAMRM